MKKIRITLHQDGTQKVEVVGAVGEECVAFTYGSPPSLLGGKMIVHYVGRGRDPTAPHRACSVVPCAPREPHPAVRRHTGRRHMQSVLNRVGVAVAQMPPPSANSTIGSLNSAIVGSVSE
jgi:hypothetical protein